MSEMERRLINLEIAAFGKTGNRWHSTDELPSGVKTGTIGASTHITDSDGFPVSKGFHSIDEEIPQMTFVGKTGATVTRFRLDMCDLIRRKISRPSPPEPQLIQGYTAEQWQEIIDGGYLCELWCLGGPKKFGILAEMNDNTNYRFGEGGSKWWSNCRPAQLKGVMRPIFVEPVDDPYCAFFDIDGKALHTGMMRFRFRKDNPGNTISTAEATKYIEL